MRRIKYAIGMIAVLLLFMLMGINITGVTNHKLLGLSFFGVMGIEVLLNLSWFTGYVERLKKSGNSLINLLWLLLNTFLMIDILLLFISSVVIAIIDSREWVFAHTLSAYVGLILIGVYIGFHWNMVLGSVRRALKLKPKNVLRNILLRIIVACMVFFGISASFNREIGEKFTYYYEEQQEEVKEDYLGNLYLDFINITSIYVAIGHYGLKTINYVKRRIVKGVRENEPVKDKE
ncbi:MAG: hypothetical protein E7270_00735 [Lachnospiraceae bacterium]|nr:hypothetical protein [Lachnospiraceae bacterium]